MAQTNFTPILTYKSDTATVVPSAGNLTNSANGAELAVNTADKRLFTKDSGGNVVELGTNPSSLTLPNSTANGVVYANGSKVLTTGSALTFDGTNFVVGGGSAFGGSGYTALTLNNATNGGVLSFANGATLVGQLYGAGNNVTLATNQSGSTFTLNPFTAAVFQLAGSEQMRLTSTGLGIGTSSPSAKLSVRTSGTYGVVVNTDNLSLGTTRLSLGGYLDAAGGTGGTAAIGAIHNHNATSESSLAFYTYGGGALNQVAVLTPSGNLGLGVTPSAWDSGQKVLQVGSGSFYGYNNGTVMASNSYYNSGWKYINTAFASYYTQVDGTHKFFTAPSGTAGDAITFTQAATLTANGEFLVGKTVTSGQPIQAKNAGLDGTASSVSTTATTIYTTPSGTTGNACFVYGDNGSHGFMDLVFFVQNTTPVVVSSQTIYGSPPARTYTSSTAALRLAVASGSYSVRAAVLGALET